MDYLSDILSIIAILISIGTFILNYKMGFVLNGPYCRVCAFSIPKGFEIQLENVGSRIMHVKSVEYIVEDKSQGLIDCGENLSKVFINIPCETKAEARLNEESLFPNSKHKLIKITFASQDKLIEAWELTSRIKVKVLYKKFIRTKEQIFDLSVDYRIFIDAIQEADGSYRSLKAFENN